MICPTPVACPEIAPAAAGTIENGLSRKLRDGGVGHKRLVGVACFHKGDRDSGPILKVRADL